MSVTIENKKREPEKCEVYSRVVGFLVPTSNMHKGKQEEFKDRKTYEVE